MYKIGDRFVIKVSIGDCIEGTIFKIININYEFDFVIALPESGSIPWYFSRGQLEKYTIPYRKKEVFSDKEMEEIFI